MIESLINIKKRTAKYSNKIEYNSDHWSPDANERSKALLNSIVKAILDSAKQGKNNISHTFYFQNGITNRIDNFDYSSWTSDELYSCLEYVKKMFTKEGYHCSVCTQDRYDYYAVIDFYIGW